MLHNILVRGVGDEQCIGSQLGPLLGWALATKCYLYLVMSRYVL